MVFPEGGIFSLYHENAPFVMTSMQAAVSREIIEKILAAGARAPSGSNSQPWQFEVVGNRIAVIGLPERDHPVLNFRNRGTWLAHGALLENIAIAARANGYEADLDLFPDASRPHVTAVITLSPLAGQSGLEPLYQAIFERCTNRKPYFGAISETVRRQLFAVAAGDANGKQGGDNGGAKVFFVEDPSAIGAIANASAVNESVMFANRKLHALMFREIVWSESEEQRHGGGLYFPTMELSAPRAAVKMLGSWSVMRAANRFGAAVKIAETDARTYAATPLMAAIAVGGDGDASYLAAGRLMERLWLQATAFGLSAHPLTGVLFMAQRIAARDDVIFAPRERTEIEAAYQAITAAAGSGTATIVAVLRIGNGGEPTARSIKLPAQVRFEG